MGVPELGVAKIKHFCSDRSPEHLRDEMRLEVEVRGNAVTIQVERPLESVLRMIERLGTVVVELERLGEAHLAFAIHSEVRDLLDRIVPESDG